VNVAIEAINRGKVFRFVPKPLDLAALVQIVQRALDNYSSQREWERMMRGFVEHSDRLQRDAQVKEQSLRDAAERIRSEEETVERQKVHIESLYAEIQEAYLHTVTSLTAAIEAKDRYTHGHAERVYYYCTLMADVLGLSESDRKDLRFASVLHDLGKIGIPDSILRKPGRLSAEEHRVMQTHPLLTEKILGPLPFMENVKRIIREHHERFDGQGYPNGIKGDVISVEGRILAVADAYDAMRSDRPYRKALGMADALTELQAGAGTQFCPLCVGALSFALAGRGELAEADASQQRSAEGEDELIRLRPASETVHIESLFN
jgi:HD-GYP domain-containing protein (c-di-GMP phosphodiesterase class II)